MSILGCTKDRISTQEQIVDAIHSKLQYVPDSPKFYVLKSFELCDHMDCDVEKFTIKGSTIVVYSREDLFMRAIDFFFEVVSWDMGPKVYLHNNTHRPLNSDLIDQECRGK